MTNHEFLDSDCTWPRKYSIGDIVCPKGYLLSLEVIVKLDLKHNKYICISLEYIASHLLHHYCEYHSFEESKTVTTDAGCLDESGIIDKVGELVVGEEFFKEIAKHIDTNSNVWML